MDKRLRLIVEAVTSQAQQGLRNLGLSIRQFGDAAGDKLDRVTHKAKGFGESLTMLETVAGAALAFLGTRYAAMASQAIVSMSKIAAKNLALEESFESVGQRYGLVSDKIVEAMQRASKNTVDRFSAIAMASKAMRLGVARDIDDFEELMKIAYVRSRETGRGVEEAWGWITQGIGGASPWILRNLNFLVDTNDVLDDHARLLDKTAGELTKLQEQEALRNYVLEQGADDLERWNKVGGDSIDVFAEQTVVAAEFRQELGELVLPAVTKLTRALIDLQRASKGAVQDQQDVIDAVFEEGGTVQEAVKALEEHNRARFRGRPALLSWQEAIRGITADEKLWLMVQEEAKDTFSDLDMKLQDARRTISDTGDAIGDVAENQKELDDALEKGADVWDHYLRDVAERTWQFGRRVEDAQFKVTEATENAAFRRYEIERNAEQSRQDMLERFGISHESALAKHYNKLRWMKQDSLDELSDMEWEHERDRSGLMRKAPYWIRYALGKEFRERERIVGTGDAKALKAFDAQLVERIRAIDPVYAQELDLLNEHYRHQEEVETREARQGRRRQRTDWGIRDREQRSRLDLQLRTLDRGLGNQLEAWGFHQKQRLEREKWSMDRLLQEQDHRLAVMKENTMHRLSEITPLFAHYGREWALALVQGMATGQPYSPLPPGYTFPETNPWGEAGGGAVALAGAGGGGGGVSIVIENLNLGAGVSMAGGRAAATELSEELGRQMRKKR